MDSHRRYSISQIPFNAQVITPPPSDDGNCSHVTELLDLLRKSRRGLPSFREPWNVFTFSLSDFEELQRRLEADERLRKYVDTIRYDYNSDNQRLIVRMASALHETLLHEVLFEIMIQLSALAHLKDPLGSFAKRIRPTGSTSLIWKEPAVGSGTQKWRKIIRHNPDASFRHLDAEYPGVVIEVSYSQKQKDLPKLADDYILESDSNIRLVIGLDLEYRGNKAAIYMWRPKIVTNEEDNVEELIAHQELVKVFSTEAGDPVPSVSLEIPIKDFAPQSTEALPDSSVSISSDKLCEFLANARHMHSGPSTQKLILQPHIRKRKRESTPEEELTPEDEAKFRLQEERAQQMASQDDSSYEDNSQEG